jgi:hypothetical protein
LFGEERQHRMRDIALDERSDERREKYRAVLGGDIDEIPQPRHIAIRGRQWHRTGQLRAKKAYWRGIGDLPPSLADANDLAIRTSGVDVDCPAMVGNAQVQAFGRLRGRQSFEDQRGVGKRLASRGGAGVGEVAGSKVSSEARPAATEQHRQVRPSAVGAEGLAFGGHSEEIPLLCHADQTGSLRLLVRLCVGAHGVSRLCCFSRRIRSAIFMKNFRDE